MIKKNDIFIKSLKVWFIYAAWGFIWVFLDNYIIVQPPEKLDLLNILSNYKSHIFIILTALLLYFFIWRTLRFQTIIDLSKKNNEELLQSVFKVAPIGIGIVCGRVFVEVNQQFCNMTGYTEEELIGTSSRILYPTQEEYENAGKKKYDQISMKGIGEVETRFLRKDGSIISILLASAPLDPSDLSKGTTFTALDITDRKESVAILAESEARYRSIFENNYAIMLLLDPATGALFDANSAALSWYGWNRDALIQKNIYEITDLPPKELKLKIDQAIRQQGGHFLFRHRKADGSLRDVEVFSGPVQLDGKSLLYCIVHDITEKKRAEEALEKRILALTRPLNDTTEITIEELFNLEEIQQLQDDFASATGVASVITKPDGKPITAPSNFCQHCREVFHGAEKGDANCHFSWALLGKSAEKGPAISKCLTAGLWIAGAPILVGGCHIATWVAEQVPDDSQTEEPLRDFARLTADGENAIPEAFQGIPQMSRAQFELVAKSLYSMAKQLSVSAYQNVQQARFISEQKRDQEKIAFLAHHDQLTGLANRTLFANCFRQAARHAQRTSSKMALCVLDIDNFKAINDSHGHHYGDQLLCKIAKRLNNNIRGNDTVGRIGGDEFIILFTDLRDVSAIAPLIQKVQSCFAPYFNFADTLHSITASMGVAVFPDDGDQFDTLFENADAAMYFAKESGRNNFQLFRQEISDQIKHRLAIEKDLRQALLNDELELHYQPIMQLPAKRIAGMEALVRWRHPAKGLVPPGEFIPVAEESNLIVSLGQWVLKTACRDIAALREFGVPVPPVSINVSAKQLFENNFAELIDQNLKGYALHPQQLELEVTESIFLESSDSVETAMNALKDIGIGLALDDFGTGYSSLSYLKRFHIDKLKIDKSFIEHVCHNEQDAALVATIIQMGHQLGIQVVTEGIEKSEQLEFLINQGCELAQGFFFSKPLPLASIQEMLGRPKTLSRF